MIIGLSGYARSGKDALGSFLVDFGYQRIAFADKVRAMAYAANPIVVARAKGCIRLRTLVDDLGWEGAKHVGEVRGYLQRLGTEGGRAVLGDNVWVDAAMRDLRIGQDYVITDVRFKSEAQAIKDRGGVVVRVERPGKEALNDHESEIALDDWDFDARIHNNGTLEDLEEIAWDLSFLRQVAYSVDDRWAWRCIQCRFMDWGYATIDEARFVADQHDCIEEAA